MIQKGIQLTFEHRVVFTRDVFDPRNETLANLFEAGREAGEVQKALVFIDEGLVKCTPDLDARIDAYFQKAIEGITLVARPFVMPGGEACKNNWELVQKIWERVHEHGLCRHSYIIAIGGGAFLDLIGFAASTAHRGVRLVRLPTTTLSQGDGGVGVKNGVNYFGKKNWVGCFAVPFAVVNDFDFLKTLPARDKRAGIIEGIKVALIRDRKFFEEIEADVEALARLEDGAVEKIVRRSCEHHVDHIAGGGDPFEMGSARPLDFGHWIAHKLEQISGFSIGHGEAVAIGMAADLLYAVRIGLLDGKSAERVLRLMEAIGLPVWSDLLVEREPQGGPLKVLRGLEEFREHLGGKLSITLLPGIGSKVEVHEMDAQAIAAALEELRVRARTTSAAAEAVAAVTRI